MLADRRRRGTSLILTPYDGLRKEMGGQQELDKFARLFMVPGMGHCGGGPSPNTSELLLQMVAWVENGQAPESIVARQGAGVRGGGVALQRTWTPPSADRCRRQS